MFDSNHPHATGLFPVRIGRASFLRRGLMLLGAGFLASLLLSGAHHAGFLAWIFCVGIGGSLMLSVLVATFGSLLVPRLRDIGVHPAWSLLFLIHALNGLFLLALLLIPSDAFVGRRYIR